MTDWLHVGQPSWDLGGRGAMIASPAEFAKRMSRLHALGVTHVQVRFPSRSRAEQAAQPRRWMTEVAAGLA